MHNKTGCVFTVQDITEQKNTQQLQHHAELALKTSEAKQQVVANISYEMRTPITGIMGMVDFLLESGLTTEQLELAKTIKDSSIGLLNSINNILDLQRIEAGKFKLNNNILSISQLLNKITSLFAALTRNKEINLKLDVDPHMPESIISDQDRLYQVITSLISIITENTSGKGLITIHLRKEKVSDVGLMIIVEIADNFSTIDIKEVNEILYPSKEKTDISAINRKDNLSVGLAISRKLIDLLDGKISVERNKNNGTTFFFTFHTTVAPETVEWIEKKQTGTKAVQNIKGVRILCVEDQKINQKVISLMLSHAQCKVTLANNGKEALEHLSKDTFDIVLLDMVMPVMDGMETLDVIGKSFPSPPPVIALSANVLDEDKDKYYIAGVQDFISKPIDADELYTKIEKWSKKQKKSAKLKKVK
jgi:CheY-like chemotaxis protein